MRKAKILNDASLILAEHEPEYKRSLAEKYLVLDIPFFRSYRFLSWLPIRYKGGNILYHLHRETEELSDTVRYLRKRHKIQV